MKININRKPISSQEIGDMQDFGSVLKGAEVVALPFYKKWWFVGGAGITIIIFVIVAALNINNNSIMPNTQVAQKPAPLNTITNNTKNITKAHTSATNNGFTSIWVESGKAKTHTMPNGTELIIAPNKFIDKNGIAVDGNIEIRYRKVYADKDTIIANVIPITYGNENNGTQVSTASMFEVNCFKDGEQVFTASKYPISILQNIIKTYATNSLANESFIGDGDILVNPKELTQIITENSVNNGKAQLKEVGSTTLTIARNQTSENREKLSNSTKPTTDEVEMRTKKPSFNISYPVNPNDSLNIALEKVVTEIKQLRTQEPKAPLKMEKAKQNFTLKFDSVVHPELSVFNETTFGVVNETHFTPALYKYKWNKISLQQKVNKNNGGDSVISNSFIVQLSNATYIGEELFYKNTKIEPEHTLWYARFWQDVKGLFSRKREPKATKKENKNLDIDVKQSTDSYIDKTIRIIPVDSGQYYYQRSDYRSPVRFEVFPVLSDEQYVKAMEEYRYKTEQYEKLLEEKKQQEKNIRKAIKKRREELISSHRKKIEIYMGLSKDNGLQ